MIFTRGEKGGRRVQEGEGKALSKKGRHIGLPASSPAIRYLLRNSLIIFPLSLEPASVGDERDECGGDDEGSNGNSTKSQVGEVASCSLFCHLDDYGNSREKVKE